MAGATIARVLIAASWLTGAAVPAMAGSDLWRVDAENATWRTECGACHLPFPPQMLAAEDWLLIMKSLDRHFGANASLDEKPRKEIAAFLDRNGGREMFADSANELPRITATAWFSRKHQGAIRLWRKGRVSSLSDCQACHRSQDS